MRVLGPCLIASIWLTAASARAERIDIVPTDSAATSYARIEGAGPGDEVVIAPGTYHFRVYLEGAGTAAAPIVIRALDPANRPVWDLDGDTTDTFPGSYTGGDRGRAIWQITGAHYDISGIVFRHGTDGGGDGGGVRFKSSDHVTMRDCLFELNDNGVQGAGTETLLEHCEMARNGLPGASEASHNLYIHGGTITVRGCYIHDATQGQNLHIRANRAVFEYNWIARATRYMGDMMPCTIAPCDSSQTMLLRGNVFIQGTPMNDGQIFVLYNDQGTAGISFHLTMVHNTFIGSGDAAPLVHFANDDAALTPMLTARIDNNVLFDIAGVFRVDDASVANVTATGTNNWLSTGTSETTGLVASVMGASPQLVDVAGESYVPAAGSPLIGAADPSVADLPDQEPGPAADRTAFRARATTGDIGAYEVSSGPPPPRDAGAGGADGGATMVDGGVTSGDASSPRRDGAIAGGDAGGGGTPADDGGCGCDAAGTSRDGPVAVSALLLGVLLLRMSRERRAR